MTDNYRPSESRHKNHL